MKRYTLASGVARRTVDLRDYKDIIVEAVATVMIEKDVTVVVEKDCYYLSPSPSQGEAIKIGRLICRSTLNKHCIHIPKLFNGMEVKSKKKEELDESRTEPKANHRVG